MLPDVSQRRERAEFDKIGAQENLTGINELRDIFMKSKKPSIPEKPKPPDTLRRNISTGKIPFTILAKVNKRKYSATSWRGR